MKFVNKSLTTRQKPHTLSYPVDRIAAGICLEEWFNGNATTKDIDLKGASNGNRGVSLLIDGHVLKETKKAKREYELLARVEELTSITPKVGAAVYDETGNGAFTMSFFRGIPLKLLSSEIDILDRVRILAGAFYSVGKLHFGDGKTVLIHGDTHSGNFILLPNPDSNNENITGTKYRAEMRVIDLEKAYTQVFTKKGIVKMAHDLLLLSNNLLCSKFIAVAELCMAIENYLEGNPRLLKKDLARELEEARKIHTKLKATTQLNFVELLS